MAAPSYTYSLTNGSTADASQVMQNYNDILNGVTDGTKDLTINALTMNGAFNCKGAITLGDATADDITITGSLASTIPIKTNNSYDIGSSTKGLAGVYLGNGGVGATCRVISASHATTRTYSVPDCAAAANFVMTEVAQTINGVKTFAGQLIGKGTTTNDTPSAGYIGEYMLVYTPYGSRVSLSTGTTANVCISPGASITLTAGDWMVSASASFIPSATTTFTNGWLDLGVSQTSATMPGAADYSVEASNGEYLSESSVPQTANSSGAAIGMTIAPYRISVSTSTTFYLVAKATFGTSTLSVCGGIRAWRVR